MDREQQGQITRAAANEFGSVVFAKILQIRHFYGECWISVSLPPPGIPRKPDQAAIMDDVGPFRLFFQIILPLLRPVVVTVIVVQSVTIFNAFTNPPGTQNATV